MAKSRKKSVPPVNQSQEVPPESRAVATTHSTAPQSARDTTLASGDRERIAMRAYELYLARGAGDGAAMEDWLVAEEELKRSK